MNTLDREHGTAPSPPTDRLWLWKSYALALVSTVAALGVRLAFDEQLHGHPTLIIFSIPIMLSAYVGGLGPGLVATTLSFFLANYFSFSPFDISRWSLTPNYGTWPSLS